MLLHRHVKKYSTCKYTVILKTGLGSLKVIGTDTNRSAAYNFLLTFQSNYGPISYRLRDKRRFQSKKIANFFHPVYFAPSLKGFPLELGIGAEGQKTRMTFDDIFSCVDTIHQRDGQTDGQTDRPTPVDSKDRAYA